MHIRSPLLREKPGDRHMSPTPISVIMILTICTLPGTICSCTRMMSGVKNATRLIMKPAFEAVVYLQPSTMHKYETNKNVPSTPECRNVSLSSLRYLLWNTRRHAAKAIKNLRATMLNTSSSASICFENIVIAPNIMVAASIIRSPNAICFLSAAMPFLFVVCFAR